MRFFQRRGRTNPLVVVLILLGWTLFSAISAVATAENVVVQVTAKHWTTTSSGRNSERRLVVSTDQGPFYVEDNLFLLRFDETELDHRILVGGTYRLKVYGIFTPKTVWSATTL